MKPIRERTVIRLYRGRFGNDRAVVNAPFDVVDAENFLVHVGDRYVEWENGSVWFLPPRKAQKDASNL